MFFKSITHFSLEFLLKKCDLFMCGSVKEFEKS